MLGQQSLGKVRINGVKTKEKGNWDVMRVTRSKPSYRGENLNV